MYQPGEVAEITIKGANLQSVNALSFALPYDTKEWEYVGIEAEPLQAMRNLTYDRLHTNGTKALYPTFVNAGNKRSINGDTVLMTIKMKAKRKTNFELKVMDGLLVDKNLNSITF